MNETYSTARGYLFAIWWRLALLLGCLATVPFVWADAPPGSKTTAATACA